MYMSCHFLPLLAKLGLVGRVFQISVQFALFSGHFALVHTLV